MSITETEAYLQENNWPRCLEFLQESLTQQIFDTWIKPLQARREGKTWVLFAPNDFVKDTVKEKYLTKIQDFLGPIVLKVGHGNGKVLGAEDSPDIKKFESNLNKLFTFENFVEGKSNQIAKAAAIQVSVYPGQGYNPLFIYGGVGLGKTHLMQAVGNQMREKNPLLKGLYLHSERFVSEMISALQKNAINDFKKRL